MERNSLYSHDNNSSSSVLYHNPSHISSVGFNTLKKQPTNTSQISSVSTKTNPLAKLFTKNRSTSNVQAIQFSGDDGLYTHSNNSQDATHLLSPEERPSVRRTSSISRTASANSPLFKLSKSKIFKQHKPDLTIQTSGHHGLKLPKKILSGNSSDQIAASPGFHGLFHRNHLVSESSPIAARQDDKVLSLSSSSSNSFVSNTVLALAFNFTNPDYSIEDIDEYSSLHDIHKKLLIPTDQFLGKTRDVGLGISSGDYDDYLSRYIVDFGKGNAKFFSSLLSMIRPILLPSQQQRLPNGKMHPLLGVSVEDLANFLRDNYMNDNLLTVEPTEVKSPRKRKLPTKLTSQSSLSLVEDLDEFKIREIHQDILTFFYRCMIIFADDNNTELPSKRSRRPSVTLEPDVELLQKDWESVGRKWTYFNTKIRFTLINMFHPLQKYLRDVTQRYGLDHGVLLDIEVENVLLVAFRDIILIPMLTRRKSLYDEVKNQTANENSQSQAPQTSASLISFSLHQKPVRLAHLDVASLRNKEEYLFRKDENLLSTLVNCFGTILCHTQNEVGTQSSDQHASESVFLDCFDWLSLIV